MYWKQSFRAYLPKLNPAVDVRKFVEHNHNGQAFIAHCAETKKISLYKACKPGSDLVLLIGPEGDFTDTEIKHAISSGFRPISLGEERLRTETAAITLCIQANTMNGLLQ